MFKKVTFSAVILSLLVAIPTVQGQKIISTSPAPAARRDNGPIYNGAALNGFFRRLTSVEARKNSRPVVVLQYGDSHTKADLFTGEVRRDLQSQFAVPGQLQSTVLQPRSTGNEAIVYQPLGVNGMRAKKLHDMTASDDYLRVVGQRNPDLIVLAFGTNEVTDNDWTVGSYQQLYEDLINRYRAAAPNASILVMGPPDRAVSGAGGWASVRRMSALIDAQRQAAYHAGAAFWSACEAMGGDGSMNTWFARGLAQGDHVHFTANGYYRLGDLFFNDLMASYRSTRGRDLPRGNYADAPRKGLSSADMKLMQGVPLTSTNRY